jgi:hypothetical protein
LRRATPFVRPSSGHSQLQPGCDVHWVSLSIAQVLITPWQPPVVHEQPMTPEQAVWVGFVEHGVTVPVQALVLQLQPYSAEQAVLVVFAEQGVIVPLQYCELHVQPG